MYSKKKVYIRISALSDLCSQSLDYFIETEDSVNNPEYGKIKTSFIEVFLFLDIYNIKIFKYIYYIMKTYGIDFPFMDSEVGNFFRMTSTTDKEIRSNLIHLLLTKKGSRYFLPDFGTRLYEYIFDQNDVITYNHIEDEIRESVRKYIPNLDIKSISITSAEDDNDEMMNSQKEDERLFRYSSSSSKPYTAKVRIDYESNNGSFSKSDFIIINI